MAGLGGVIFASRLSSVDLNAGSGTILLDAIAAAVIGGTSLFGGRGEVKSALLGALIIASIANGMSLLGYSSATQYIVTGVDPAGRGHARHGLASAPRRLGQVTAPALGVAHARLRLHGQGPLARAARRCSELDPPLAAAARLDLGPRPRRRGRGRARGTAGARSSPTGASRSRTTASGSSSTAARTRSTPSRRSRPRGPASTSSARSRSASTPPSRTGCGARPRTRASSTRAASTTASCPADAPRARADRAGGRRRRRPLPRALPPVVGLGRADERLALRPLAGRHRRDRRPRRAHHRPRRATSSARSRRVAASVRTFVPGREVDDAFAATVEFENGAVGTLEASRLALGRINQNAFEINGSEGSIAFDLERFDELLVSDGGPVPRRARHRRLVAARPQRSAGATRSRSSTRTCSRAIAGEAAVAPHGATFEDGYRAAEVCDAILRSAERGQNERGSRADEDESRHLGARADGDALRARPATSRSGRASRPREQGAARGRAGSAT